MKAYHFVNAEFGLEDIKLRRLKIATIPDLNDPFELLCADLSNADLREKIKEWKVEVGKCFGMVCFSKSWSNPVQWSHYADKHRGLCLKFDLLDPSNAFEVNYNEQRSDQEVRKILINRHADINAIRKFLTTKYAHWTYEQELRIFQPLKEKDPSTGLYFYNFETNLRLTEVVIGAESNVTRTDVEAVLGDLKDTVSIRKARLAFKTFEVTTQNNSTLWN